MKKSCFLVLAFIATLSMYAQSNILNATKPDEIGKKSQAQIENDANTEPLPYGYVDDRDVMWAKTTWEYIDLNQRVNFPLLFPLDKVSQGRRSLFEVLIEAIKKDSVTMYYDSYFHQTYPMEQLETNLSVKVLNDEGIAAQNAGEAVEEWHYSMAEIKPADVAGYRIRGYWYVDKRQGDLRWRLLALCPVVVSAQNKLQQQENPDLEVVPVDLFWVFYPEVRKQMHANYVFNEQNSAVPITFDHLLNSRRFDAVIEKEDNVYGDREVDDYIADNTLMQLLESQRIKETIRDFEANLWNY
ncbi:gliding motility protein GldN [Mesonia sp. K7]|uniref:type IX secretion system ring protein PorN/GldN n=1 Tax=Mesonia sp. K7 TaxID=2218606 RepID=UPI000DA9527E|nr:gliding motility protein GldN [Mesonia sp. K7]PZD78712.1 gliding motility protein GldN [Mesonia sp. K7]